jgi:hypothetical protein
MKKYVRYSQNIKKAYDSVRREVSYNILLESGVPMNLVTLIRMYLNETFNKVHIGEYLSVSYPE